MDAPTIPRSRRRADWIGPALAAVVAFVLLYHGAYRMLPAGDDWQPPLSEIYRSSVSGPWSLVTHNAWYHPQWRPLQSLAFVALSKLPGDLFAWVSVLNAACFGVALTAVLLWSRALRLPPIATYVAALALVAHPINVAAVASNDGFGSVLAPATAWLCCWILFRFRDRPWLAIAIVVPIYVAASGVKEYVFALVPMACATTLLTYSRPVRWTFTVGAILSAVTGALLAVRSLLVPLRSMGDATAFSVVGTAKNTVMGVVAALAPADTVAFFTTTGTTRVVVFALGGCLTLAIVGVGLIRRDRVPALLALLTLGSLFPANVAMRISEMYLFGLGIGVSLLLGCAARALVIARRSIQVALAAMLVVWLTWASMSTLSKVAEMRRTGELSYALGRFVADALPPERGQRVAILYDDAAVRRLGGYSVFRVPRSGLVLTETLQWFRPGRGDKLTALRVGGSLPAPDLDAYDVVIAWDVDRWTGTVLKR